MFIHSITGAMSKHANNVDNIVDDEMYYNIIYSIDAEQRKRYLDQLLNKFQCTLDNKTQVVYKMNSIKNSYKKK